MMIDKLKDALADIDIVEARNLLIGGVIVGAAAVLGLGVVNADTSPRPECMTLIQPTPQVIRPVAEEQWFLPPMSLAMAADDEEPEKDAAAAIEDAVRPPAAVERHAERRRHHFYYYRHRRH